MAMPSPRKTEARAQLQGAQGAGRTLRAEAEKARRWIIDALNMMAVMWFLVWKRRKQRLKRRRMLGRSNWKGGYQERGEAVAWFWGRGIGKNKRASLGRRENLGSGGQAGDPSPHWIAWELYSADPILSGWGGNRGTRAIPADAQLGDDGLEAAIDWF